MRASISDPIQSEFEGDSPPTDYAELFETYFKYAVRLARKFNLEDPEDAAADIFCKLYSRDMLQLGVGDENERNPVIQGFDVDYVSVHNGREYAANFRTYLSGYIISYLRGKYHMQKRRRAREIASLNAPIASSEDFTLLDLLSEGASQFDGIESVVEGQQEQHTIAYIMRFLLELYPRQRGREVYLPKLFLEMVKHTREFGRIDRAILADQFGVSFGDITHWVLRLRTHLAELGLNLAPKPEKEWIPPEAESLGAPLQSLAPAPAALEPIRSLG